MISYIHNPYDNNKIYSIQLQKSNRMQGDNDVTLRFIYLIIYMKSNIYSKRKYCLRLPAPTA